MNSVTKSLGKVFCSIDEHEDQLVNMVDSDPLSKKSLYCCLCMMEQSDQNFLPKTLKTVKAFINSTSEAFEKARSNAQGRGDAPPELADQISKKGEYLEKLTNNLNQQKAQLRSDFKKIRESILKLIDEKEKEYEKTIDDQLKAGCDLYGEYERILTTGWPKPSDLDQLFPVQSEIEQRFAKVTDTLQLELLVEGLKGDINADQMFSGEESRIEHLKHMIKSFREIEVNPPEIDLTELQIENLQELLKEKLDEVLSERAPVLNPISKSGGRVAGSSLLEGKDLNLFRSWLPKKFKLNLKLLYKSSTDGQRASDFHAKCDNQGPTITVIKCRFNGADKSSIIGGFSDQDWLSNTSYSISTESFVFSLTNQVKCPIENSQQSQQYATYRGHGYGPTFGGGHDIHVGGNFVSESYCNPHSCENSYAIADFPGRQGGKVGFEPEEIEVFSIN